MAEKKKVLSFDVGILNLAFCILEKDGDKFSIQQWEIINMVDDRQKCQFILRGGKQCDNNAKFHVCHKEGLDIFGEESGKYTCETHKSKTIPCIIPVLENVVESKKESKKNKKEHIHEKEKRKCILCENEIDYELNTNPKYCWCDAHYMKGGKAFEKKITCKKFTVGACTRQPIQDMTEKIIRRLDLYQEQFLSVDEVLIENQPCLKNPTMKTIASILYTYFVMRGIIDKVKSNIKLVKFVSASNKLKVDKEKTKETINKDVIVKDSDKSKATVKEERKIYDLTKNLGIKYCMALICDKDKKILEAHKKKDDLCDSFLQGFQYLFPNVPDVYVSMLAGVATE